MFGERIGQLRRDNSMSQVELAGQLHVSKQTISNWENNNILPSIEMLVKIADFFAVPTDFLLERDDRHYLDVTGLSGKQVAHIRQLIEDILE